MLSMHVPHLTPPRVADALSDLPSTSYLRALIAHVFPGQSIDFLVSPLPGDASDRRYYRLQFATAPGGNRSLVLMRLTQPYTAGELPFVNVQRYLAPQGLPVPQILWDDSTHGFILLEDLGDVTLQAALQGASRTQAAGWYRQAVDLLLSVQYPKAIIPRGSCVAFRYAFDVEKLMWELDFFLLHMLKQLCAQQLTTADEVGLRGQFWKI